MTQYKFTVNSSSVIGNLTWNANGTLQTLAITDPFNSSNQQTCTYGYDDLVRIASVGCGTKWGQTFSFSGGGQTTGAFGNLTKTGSNGGITFNPNYSSTTNRITSAGSQTFAYDANGSLTSTGTGTGTAAYAWDADGHMATDSQNGQTSVGLTYDALGRAVEQARGSSYTEIVYDPSGGKLALMSGQTLTKGFVPLPAGGTAVYTSSGLAYYRHSDWLGSSRFASTPSRTKYYDAAYAPFGEPYAESGTTDRNFTGQNQDTTPNLYDFLFREHDYTQGRWISADPLGLAAVDLTDPQTWNRYAYVRNSPAFLVDPLGLDSVTCGPNLENCTMQVTSGAPAPTDGGGSGADPSQLGGNGGFGAAGSSSAGGTKSGGSPCIVEKQDQDPILFASLCPEEDASALLAAAGDPPQQGLQAAQGCQNKQAGGGDNISQLRLIVKSDCLDGNGRWIDYSLINISGAPVQGKYGVTEHFRAGEITTVTTGYPNQFDDWVANPFFPGLAVSDHQHFTIGLGPSNNNGPTIPVRMADGKDYGELGIYRKATGGTYPIILVNGKEAPVRSPRGKNCANDTVYHP